MSSSFWIQSAVGVLPVLGFLIVLVFLDSYRLVTPARIAHALGYGASAAVVCFLVNTLPFSRMGSAGEHYAWLGAPVVEESLKAAALIWWIRRGRIAFLVEGALLGFAVGAGFAFTENLIYAASLRQAHLSVHVIRGFGTAIMHGGATALVGVLARSAADRRSPDRIRFALPALVAAIAIHMIYNIPWLPAVANAAVLMAALPAALALAFARSEGALRRWLGEGFDKDVELLEMLDSGAFLSTPAGRYLQSLKTAFPAPVLADMLCLLQLSLELSMRAKAELLKREVGFSGPPDPAIRARFREMKYLEKSIGSTGRLALAPLLPAGTRDIWQIKMLGERES